MYVSYAIYSLYVNRRFLPHSYNNLFSIPDEIEISLYAFTATTEQHTHTYQLSSIFCFVHYVTSFLLYLHLPAEFIYESYHGIFHPLSLLVCPAISLADTDIHTLSCINNCIS